MGERINLEKNVIESAKIASCKIDDKETRIRAYALNLAANAAAQSIELIGLEADTKLSLFRVASFAKSFELADIYVNGFRFDVRVTFDGKTFTVPKTHEKYDAVPLAYIVVNLENTDTADVLGFVAAQEMDYARTDSPYFSFNTDILKPMEEIKELIDSSELSIHPYSVKDHEKIKELSAAFMDDEIFESEKVYFIKHVIACPVCRETFCDVNDFDMILSHLKNYPELFNDSTLSILAGNKQEVDVAFLSSLAVMENSEENEEESSSFTVVPTPVVVPMAAPLVPIIGADINLETPNEDLTSLFDISEEENAIQELSENKEESKENETSESLEEMPFLVEEIQEEAYIPEQLETAETVSEEKTQENTDEILEETIVEEFEEVNLQEPEEMIQEITDEILEEEPAEIENISENINENFDEHLSEGLNVMDGEDLILEEHDLETELLETPLETTIDTPLEEFQEEYVLNENEEIKEELQENPITDEDTMNSLELEDLETLDALEEIEPHSLEEIHEQPLEQEPIEEMNDSTEAEQEPFNLSLEGEEEPISEENTALEPLEEDSSANIEDSENLIEENFEIHEESFEEPFEHEEFVEAEQEPVELKYDEEEIQQEQLVEEPVQEEYPAEPEVQEENSEIQDLLDDDLMALLADDYDPSNNPSVESDGNVNEENEENVTNESNETLGTLFENNEEENENSEGKVFELSEEPVSEQTVKATKRVAILAGLLVVLAAAGGGMWFMNHQKAAQDNTIDSANQGDQLFDFQNKGSNGDAEESPAVSQDINRSMTNSFSDKPAAITITKISWQVSEKLASEPSVKEYLQTAGKNIQMNLQNDLANSADVAFSNSVKVSFEIAPDNTLKGIQVLESSGSDKIDETISRSIKNTLKYVNVPKLKDYKSDYFLTLIINF